MQFIVVMYRIIEIVSDDQPSKIYFYWWHSSQVFIVLWHFFLQKYFVDDRLDKQP